MDLQIISEEIQNKGGFYTSFLHVFRTIFAMGHFAINQISFKGNVYEKIRKSTLDEIFHFARLHGLVAL